MSYYIKTQKAMPYIMAAIFCFSFAMAQAQIGTVKGQVKNNSEEPVSGASVVARNTKTNFIAGTITDSLGVFSFPKLPPGGPYSFTVTHVSYESQTLAGYTIKEDILTSLIVKLKPVGASALDEIVVVGYGTQKRKDVTGAVVSVDQQRIENMPNSNFQQVLQGALPGISVTQESSSAEGNGSSIVIRGQKSIPPKSETSKGAGNEPLIVLDGIIYNGYLSDITPSDIATINVLKDASAAAIFGSRGTNGVILITTKKGSLGKTIFSYEGVYGTQKVARFLPLLTPEEFYDYKNIREPGKMTLSEQAVYDSKDFTDWKDLGTRTGSRLQQTISARGGNENLKYFASLNYLNSKGVSVGDDFQRVATRVNLDANLASWLTYSTNTQLAWSDRGGNGVAFGDAGASMFNPLTRAFDSLGNQLIYPWPEDVFFGNPLAPLLSKNQDNSYAVSTVNSFLIKFPFVKGLTYQINTGVDYRNRIVNTYWGRDTKTGLSDNGRYTGSTNSARNYMIDNLLNYENSFGKHNIWFTGLYGYEYNDIETTSITATGFPDDKLTYYQARQAQSVLPNASYTRRVQVYQMARINYSYDSRYSLTATLRHDGSSVFGENDKYGTFPGIGLSWNIHNESFMQHADWLSNLKLRLTYGTTGNQGIDAYSSLATVAVRSYVDGNTLAPGYIPNKLAIPNLKWETTNSSNIGFDFGFLNNRITGSIDAYTTRTHDLLITRLIPSQNGASSIMVNIGKTANKGMELLLNTANIQKRDFTWNTNFNISFNRNKIVDLYGDGKSDTLNRWFIGHPIDVTFGTKFIGVWQKGDADTAKYGTHLGWAKILDLDSNGKIDASDRMIQGSLEPKFIWGMGNTFKYKNLSLYVFMQGVQGTSRNNQYMSDNNVQSNVRYNTMRKNWWTLDNPTNEFYGNILNANSTSAPYMQNSSFLRMKDVLLAYEFSKKLLDRAGINKLKIYLEARNLFTITKWTGLDPELDQQNGVPLQREFMIGLNLGF